MPLDFEVTALKYQGPSFELRFYRLEMFIYQKIPEVEVEKTVEEMIISSLKVPAPFKGRFSFDNGS